MIKALILYIFANIYDYSLTVYGLLNNRAEEWNWMAQKFMDAYGIHIGLSLYKSILIVIPVIACIIFKCLAKRYPRLVMRRRILRLVLISGSVVMIIASSLWLMV